MKIYARLTNEKGKVDGMGANEYMNLDITVGNEVLAKLTVRQTINGWGIFDENDKAIKRLQEEGKWDCNHNPLCDEKDKSFCIDNIPF